MTYWDYLFKMSDRELNNDNDKQNDKTFSSEYLNDDDGRYEEMGFDESMFY